MLQGPKGERHLRLTPLHGLRFGRNRLTVVAHDSRSRADVERRTFRVRRSGPMPAARFPTIAAVTGRALLNAGPSRAAHGGRLHFRWRLLQAPRGSHARLRRANGKVARIRPDRRGRYRLRLTVREDRRRPDRRRGPRASASAAATPATYDFEVAAQPPIPPYGLPLSTSTGGISYDGTTYAPSGSGIQVMVIDRATAGILSNTTIPSSPSPDIATLAGDMLGAQGAFAASANYGQIVVIEGGSSSPNEDTSDLSALAAGLALYGADNPEVEALSITEGRPFAMVAVRGMQAGEAAFNPDNAVLGGMLRTAGSGGELRFEQTAAVPFDLGAVNQNAEIGPLPNGTTVGVPPPPPNGASLNVLDAHTLAPLADVTVTSGSSVAPLVAVLNDYVNDPSALFLLRFNAFGPAPYNDVANVYAMIDGLAQAGASRDLLVRSMQISAGAAYPGQGGSNYAFLGGPGVNGVDGSPLKTIAEPSGGSTAVSDVDLQGFLVPNENGRFEASSASSSASFVPTLRTMADTPPKPYGYPDGDTTAYQAAEQYLYSLLVTGATPVLCDQSTTSVCTIAPGIRINYGNAEFTSNLGAIKTALSCGGTLVAPSGATQYTQTQLNALQGMICGELDQQDTVDSNLIQPLESLMVELESDSTLELLGASSIVQGYVNDSTPVAGLDALGVARAASELLGEIANDLDDVEGAEEVGSILTLGSDTMDLAGELSRSDTAQDQTDKQIGSIEVEAGDLSKWVSQRYDAAQSTLTEIEALVFSDPSKLAAAAQNALGGGAWDIGPTSSNQADVIKLQNRLASLSYMFPQLVGAASKQSCTKYQTSTTDPMSYIADVAVGQINDGAGHSWLQPFQARIDSLKLSSSDAATLGSQLFTDGAAGYDIGGDPTPIAASLVQSDFFMRQLIPANNAACNYELIELEP
jgi:hypothetical protein